jgi:hypothetical protein
MKDAYERPMVMREFGLTSKAKYSIDGCTGNHNHGEHTC